ncbi:hypothetical protein C0993_008385, partial [Termitomyces sp. T159_Od127]
LANPDTPPDAPAPQDEAWTRLLHLETQVQLTQASLTHHMTELSTLHQTTDHISQSLQALLEHLPPRTAPPLVAEPSLAAPAVPAGPQVQLPCLALPNTYNGDHTSRECFFQSCFTYIHLSRDAFDSDTLKIAWVLSYMKAKWASTYALHVLRRPGGVGSFTDWATFKKDFWAEFFPIDPAKSAAWALARHCPLGLEVRYLSTMEQEELLLQLLAAKNTAGAPSPDELALELAQEESGAYAPLPGLEEDF